MAQVDTFAKDFSIHHNQFKLVDILEGNVQKSIDGNFVYPALFRNTTERKPSNTIEIDDRRGNI